MDHKYRQDLDYSTIIESEAWGTISVGADATSVSLRCEKGPSVSMTHAEFDQVVGLVNNYRKMREAGGLEIVS